MSVEKLHLGSENFSGIGSINYLTRTPNASEIRESLTYNLKNLKFYDRAVSWQIATLWLPNPEIEKATLICMSVEK